MLSLLVAVSLGGCAATNPAPRPSAPYVLVLGTAQDGGLPQIGCTEPLCQRARREPSRRRLVTSLLLVDPSAGRRYLFDASPDLSEQVELARGHPPNRAPEGHRPPLFDGVFLTHAHMGHYTGLLELGNEAYGSKGVQTHVSERMATFLTSHHPWRFMVETGALELRRLEVGGSVQLSDELRVEAVAVPHRDEFSDTLAFVIHGPSRSLLYLPDIDKWERWDTWPGGATAVEDVLASVDVALVDGSFYAEGELPGRSMADIPHPFISESMERWSELRADERAKVYFTHLNHTNPATDPKSVEGRAVRNAGMAIAADGQLFEL